MARPSSRSAALLRHTERMSAVGFAHAEPSAALAAALSPDAASSVTWRARAFAARWSRGNRRANSA